MKKRIFAVVMTAMMTVSMAVTAFAADTTSNLIGKFTFDENITNEVTGTDAKIVAQKSLGADAAAVDYTFAFVDGVDGKALQLGTDATGAANNNGLNLGLKVADGQNYTISVWVKAVDSSINFACPIVWMGKMTQSPENWVGLWSNNGFLNDYLQGPALGSNDSAGHRFGASPTPDEGLGSVKAIDGAATTFEWSNVTAVVKDGIGWLYYDGKLVGSTEGLTTAVLDDEGNPVLNDDGTEQKTQALFPDVNEDDTVSMYLGVNAWDAPFKGYVDDLYIYDRALSSEDVAQLVADTNKAGVTLGEFTEFVTTTTIDYTQKPSINKEPDWLVTEDDEPDVPWGIIIAAAVVVVLVVVIVLVLVISKSKKKGTNDDKEV